jgi:hypothetical protein
MAMIAIVMAKMVIAMVMVFVMVIAVLEGFGEVG